MCPVDYIEKHLNVKMLLRMQNVEKNDRLIFYSRIEMRICGYSEWDCYNPTPGIRFMLIVKLVFEHFTMKNSRQQKALRILIRKIFDGEAGI